MILSHARAGLGQAARRPFALLLALAVPTLLVPLVPLAAALPLGLQLVMGGALGGLADALLRGLLARSERFPFGSDGPLPMPTLPLGPRQRALGDALAAAPILLAGCAVAMAVERTLAAGFLADMAAVGAETRATAAVVLLLLPATIGASLQAGRGGLAQAVGIATPGVLAVAAWRLGLLTGPVSLLGLVLGAGLLALALGPLPEPRLPWSRRVAPGPLVRPARPAAAALGADLRRGLLLAHLRALPMVAVALVPIPITGRHPELGPAFYVAIAVVALALGAAFMPLGRTPFGTGRGPLSPWSTLPVARHHVARVLYLHAVLCLLGLPLAALALGIGGGVVDGIAGPVVVLLGVPVALPVAAALTGLWLGSWRRATLAVLAALAVCWLTLHALSAPGLGPLALLPVASLLAGLLPVAALLRPQRLAPA